MNDVEEYFISKLDLQLIYLKAYLVHSYKVHSINSLEGLSLKAHPNILKGKLISKNKILFILLTFNYSYLYRLER